MGSVSSYRELVAWQKAISLADAIYALTRDFPKHEVYGLTAQLRRAAVSIPSNLAEGSVRGNKEFQHFISIARGSLAEIETQLVIATRQGYLALEISGSIETLTNELSRILMGLLKSLKSSN